MVFSIIIVFVGVLSLGAFYAAGASNYGVANVTNYASLDNSSSLYASITTSQDTLVGGNIEPQSGVGYVLSSVYTVGKGLLTGEYLTVGLTLIVNMLGMSGVAVPQWVGLTLTMMLIFAFVVGVANAFLAGKGI